MREYDCDRYLRRHTTVIFGQIINAGFPWFIYTPFHYFTYVDSNGEWNFYVFVVTRDEGPLVYNPVNGDFIGSYDDLRREMGCEVKPYQKPFFPIQPQHNKLSEEHSRCTGDLMEKIAAMHRKDKVPVQPTSKYTCSHNAYNCDAFNTHAEAQKLFEICGGITNDVHHLDRDADGVACESLP